MNNRDLGRKCEALVAKYLESQGWQTERGFKKVAFIKGRLMPITYDLFGSIDVLALRNGTEFKAIQVTAGQTAARKRKIFQTWEAGELWEHLRAGVFRIHRKEGHPEVVDVKAEAQ